MKTIFNNIKEKAEKDKRGRYPTNIQGVQTLEDVTELLEQILIVIDKLDERIINLETK